MNRVNNIGYNDYRNLPTKTLLQVHQVITLFLSTLLQLFLVHTFSRFLNTSYIPEDFSQQLLIISLISIASTYLNLATDSKPLKFSLSIIRILCFLLLV